MTTVYPPLHLRHPMISRRRQEQILASVLIHGRAETARRTGLRDNAVRNYLHDFYLDLGLPLDRRPKAARAAVALGWLVVPADVLAAVSV